MDVLDCLRQIDDLTKNSSTTSLQHCIHEIARTLKSEDRIPFISLIEKSLKETNQEKTDEFEFEEWYLVRFYELENILDSIKERELYWKIEYNESYDSFYNPDEDEYLYFDPCGIVKQLECVTSYIHVCYQKHLYSYAYALYKQLIETINCIKVHGHHDEFIDFDHIARNFSIRLPVDYSEFMLEVCISAYMSEPMEERVTQIDSIFSTTKNATLTLKKMVSYANCKLLDFDQFLKDWLSYIVTTDCYRTYDLLYETIAMMNDAQYCLNIAKEYVNLHPSLYKLCLDRFEFDQKEKLQIALEALNHMEPTYKVYSELALTAATLARNLGQDTLADLCLLKAFRSDITVVNYLRLLLETNHKEIMKLDAQNIIETSYLEGKPKYSYFERERTYVSDICYDELCFFSGDFDSLILQKESPLSRNEIKEDVLLLFIAYLFYKYQIDTTYSFCLNVNFTKDQYVLGIGTRNNRDLNDEETFKELFCKWITMYEIHSKYDDALLLEYIQNTIDRIVNEAVQTCNRSMYGTCALYVYLLATLMEEMGQSHAKHDLYTFYITKYPKHRNLRDAFKRYFMNA